MEVSKLSARKRVATLCTLAILLTMTTFLATNHPQTYAAPSSVVEQPPATAIISLSPKATADTMKAAGSTVIFNVTLASSPSITLFGVWLQFNTSVLQPVSNAIDYSGNILGVNAKPQSECIGTVVIFGGSQLCPLINPDVVSLVLYNLGNQTSSTPGGLLYRVTFKVLESGFARLHILQYTLDNGAKAESYGANTVDGYFTNRYCGGTTYCRPLNVTFTFLPRKPATGGTVSFNASSSVETNSGGTITSYTWSWGEQSPCRGNPTIQNTVKPIITHVFCSPQNFAVSLLVSDSYGVTWGSTQTVTVTYVWLQLYYSGPILVDHKFGLTAGTVVRINAGVTNNSTQFLLANLTITVNTFHPIVWTKSFNLSGNGQGGNTGTIGPLFWNTTADLPIQVYRIDLDIKTSVQQNNTSLNHEYAFVQFVVPESLGLLSLNLLQTSGVAILVIAALVAGLGRFRKKPSWETEELTPG